MIKQKVQKVVLAGIVLNGENKILIVQRSMKETVFPGLWELPSGKKEFDESSEQGLMREIQEETGLSVKIVMPISVFDYHIERESEIRYTTQINFLTTPLSHDVILSPEHDSYAWVGLGDIAKYEISSQTKGVIVKAFDFIKTRLG